MDHETAVRANAVERYVLGDLPLAEVEDFERHFYECSQCSEELSALSILTANLRVVLSEEAIGSPLRAQTAEPAVENPPAVASREAAPEVPSIVEVPPSPPETRRRWWREPWTLGPSIAALAFAFVAGYQALFLMPAGGGKVEAIDSFVLHGPSRGEENAVSPAKGASEYILQMDKVSESEVPSFHGIVRDEAGGKERYTFQVPNPGAGRQVTIRIPISALPSGRYILSLDGGGVSNYPFTVTLK